HRGRLRPLQAVRHRACSSEPGDLLRPARARMGASVGRDAVGADRLRHVVVERPGRDPDLEARFLFLVGWRDPGVGRQADSQSGVGVMPDAIDLLAQVRATAQGYDVFGELGRKSDDDVWFLAREQGQAALVALRLKLEAPEGGGAPVRSLEVAK